MKRVSTQIIKTTALLLISTYTAFAATGEQHRSNPFSFNAEYLGDFVSNVSGGIKTGSVYMGLVNLGLGFDTEKAGMWKGGEFSLQTTNTHGGMASGDLIGDIQVLSNIENGNHTYLWELYYKQSFERFSVQGGLFDLNAEFLTSECAGFYLNSAFGIHSSVALNVPVSIFPKSALGLSFAFEPTENLTFRGAVYDGDPGSLEDDPHNLNWRINPEDGLFFIGEVEYNLCREENNNTVQKESLLLGTYKIGTYYHSGTFENIPSGYSRKGNHGLYLVADQFLIPRTAFNNRSLSVFLQAGWSPADRNINNTYLGTGVNLRGLLFNRYQDVFGAGIAYAKISTEIPGFNGEMIPGIIPVTSAEAALEFFYKLQIIDQVAIQPGFHYIINPGAIESLDNAVVPVVRLEIGL